MLGIKKIRTTALHPQSDRQVERQHQTILHLSKLLKKIREIGIGGFQCFFLLIDRQSIRSSIITRAKFYFRRDLKSDRKISGFLAHF